MIGQNKNKNGQLYQVLSSDKKHLEPQTYGALNSLSLNNIDLLGNKWEVTSE